MKKKTLLLSVFILALLSVAVWISYQTLEVHVSAEQGFNSQNALCGVSEKLDCKKVAKSEWSSIFGIPLGSYGIAFYGFLAFLFLQVFFQGISKLNILIKATHVLFFFSSLFSIWLFIVSKFFIGTLCPLCLILYVINIAIYLVTFFTTEEKGVWKKLKASISIYTQFISTYKKPNVSKVMEALLAICAFALICVWATFSQNLIRRDLGQKQFLSEMNAWPIASKLPIELDLSGSVWGDYYKGDPEALIEIVEFADFECPFCRKLSIDLESILKPYTGKYYFVYKNYPIDQSCNKNIKRAAHESACYASIYTRCAGEQGKFWQAYNYIINLNTFSETSDPELIKDSILHSVGMLDLDYDGLKECMDSGRQRDRVIKDVADGDKLKVKGTPSLYINGKRVKNITKENIVKILDQLS